jgi:hypothetical protein
MDWQELSKEVLTYFETIGGTDLLYLLDICGPMNDWEMYFARDMSDLDYEYDLEDMINNGDAYDEDGGTFNIAKPYYYYDGDLNIISTSNPDIFSVDGLLNIGVVEDIYNEWKEIYESDSDFLEGDSADFISWLPKYVKDLFIEYYCNSEVD